MKDFAIKQMVQHCLQIPRARVLVLLGKHDGPEYGNFLANRVMILFPGVARHYTENLTDLRLSIKSQPHHTIVNIGIASMKPPVDAQIEIHHRPTFERIRGLEPSCVYVDTFCDRDVVEAATRSMRRPDGHSHPIHF